MLTRVTNCTFSNPVRFDNTVPTLPTHVFEFRNSTCVVTESGVISTTSPTSTQLAAVGYNPTTTISSSTSIQIYGAFSAGEILISFLLICIITMKIMEFIAAALSNIKTKKTYMAYGGGDVEIREDL